MFNRTPILLAAALFAAAAPAAAQVPRVIAGRVEDAATREPIFGARVFAPDSTAAVYTDSLGAFAIQVGATDPLAVQVEQYGYISQRFDLPDEASSSISVLLLEPEPIQLSGINVVSESAITRVLDRLDQRRSFYQGSLNVLDRAALDRFAPVGSVWDLLRQRVPQLFECDVGKSRLCVRGRGPSLNTPDPIDSVKVCVDSWESWGAVGELETLDVHSVALVEIYGLGRGGIRIYTAGYLAQSARKGFIIAHPLIWPGC